MSVGSNWKADVKFCKCRVSTKNLHHVFHIGEHPTVLTCLPIIQKVSSEWPLLSECLDQSFKWMPERPSSVNWYLWNNCSLMLLLVWGWMAKSLLTHLHSGLRWRALPKNALDKFKNLLSTTTTTTLFAPSLLAELQEYHGLWDAVPTLCFALVPNLFIFREWDNHSCKTSHISWMLTMCCQCS